MMGKLLTLLIIIYSLTGRSSELELKQCIEFDVKDAAALGHCFQTASEEVLSQDAQGCNETTGDFDHYRDHQIQLQNLDDQFCAKNQSSPYCNTKSDYGEGIATGSGVYYRLRDLEERKLIRRAALHCPQLVKRSGVVRKSLPFSPSTLENWTLKYIKQACNKYKKNKTYFNNQPFVEFTTNIDIIKAKFYTGMSLLRLEASGCLNNPGRDRNGGEILKFVMNSASVQTDKDSPEEAILHEAWRRTRAKMFDSGWSDMVSGDTSILKIVMQREAVKYASSPYYRYLYTPAHPVDLENFEGFWSQVPECKGLSYPK